MGDFFFVEVKTGKTMATAGWIRFFPIPNAQHICKGRGKNEATSFAILFIVIILPFLFITGHQLTIINEDNNAAGIL